MNNLKENQLILRQTLFWDVDVQTLDFSLHKVSIIERITQRGRLQEFRDLLKFYGREEVKNILLKVRYLDKKTLAFCGTIFNISKTEFRCYKLAQSNPEHWHY